MYHKLTLRDGLCCRSFVSRWWLQECRSDPYQVPDGDDEEEEGMLPEAAPVQGAAFPGSPPQVCHNMSPEYTFAPSTKPSCACMLTVLLHYTHVNAQQVDHWRLVAEQTSTTTPPSPCCMLKSRQDAGGGSVCTYVTNDVLHQRSN